MGASLWIAQVLASRCCKRMGKQGRERLVLRPRSNPGGRPSSEPQLGVVERRHQVLRRALELHMDDKGGHTLSVLKDAAIYVPPKLNGMSFTTGFTPTQWVLGKTPQQDLSLMSELYNPGVDNIDEATHFANIQQKRLQAASPSSRPTPTQSSEEP